MCRHGHVFTTVKTLFLILTVDLWMSKVTTAEAHKGIGNVCFHMIRDIIQLQFRGTCWSVKGEKDCGRILDFVSHLPGESFGRSHSKVSEPMDHLILTQIKKIEGMDGATAGVEFCVSFNITLLFQKGSCFEEKLSLG